MPAASILPDTCAWIDFFRDSQTPLAAAVEQALVNGSVVTCGVVLFELTQGIKSTKEEKALTSAFQAVPFLDLSRDHWTEAGRLSATLRAKGHILPLSDILISILAKEYDVAVLTVDRHFALVPGLRVSAGD
jgi:predicted nucleic acid-binding protein